MGKFETALDQDATECQKQEMYCNLMPTWLQYISKDRMPQATFMPY